MNVLRGKTPLLVVVVLGVAYLTALGLFKRRPAVPVEQTAEQSTEAVGLYRVWKGGKLGFIDNTGRLVIPPRSGLIVIDGGTYPEFAEGLARIEVETGEPAPGGLGNRKKVGFVDASGRVVIEPQFDSAYEFRHGLARVDTAEGTGYIDKTGKYVWPPSK